MLSQLNATFTKANLYGEEVLLSKAANDHIGVVPTSGNGKPDIIPLSRLHLAFKRGQLTFPFDVPKELPEAANQTPAQRLAQDMMMQYVHRMMQQEHKSSRRIAQSVINEVSREYEDTHPPSVSTLLRAVKRFTEFGNVAHLARKRPQRFDDAAEDLFTEIISDVYLKIGGASVAEAWIEYKKTAQKRFKGKVKYFSRSTFYKKVKQLHRLIVIEAREGVKAARQEARTVQHSLLTSKILQRVEMDAVHINVGLKNEKGQIVTQVILYTLIDCYSRCILGHYLQEKKIHRVKGYKDESKASILQSLIHALSPKPSMSFVNGQFHWSMYGIGELNVMDASGKYCSHDISGFICAAGGDPQITEAGAGYRKPYIERFFGTLRTQCLSIIPGYVGKMKEAKYYDYPVEQHACLTVKQFDALISNYIVTRYHQQPHKGLGMKTPQQVWDESLHNSTAILKVHDIDRLLRKNIKPIPRTLQGHQGIQINNVFYNSDALKDLFDFMKDTGNGNNPEVECVYTALENHHIWVKHPYTGELIVARPKDSPFEDETFDAEDQIEGSKHEFGFNHPLIAAKRAERDEHFEALAENKRNNPLNTEAIKSQTNMFQTQSKTDSAPTIGSISDNLEIGLNQAVTRFDDDEEFEGGELYGK